MMFAKVDDHQCEVRVRRHVPITGAATCVTTRRELDTGREMWMENRGTGVKCGRQQKPHNLL